MSRFVHAQKALRALGPVSACDPCDSCDHGSMESRYSRQVILPGWGDAAQSRLAAAHALVVGCGALGCAQIELLARAGLGTLTLVDRDVVELTNLQRQSLFSEEDARSGMPKAEAAKRRIAAVNSQVRVHACVEHLDAGNAQELARGCTVIVDGLDNYSTRFVLNDMAVKLGVPYVYAGAVGTRGMSMPVLPVLPALPCLRCIFPDLPAAGGGETCDTAGVFGPTVASVAAHAAAETLKLAAGLDAWMDLSLWQVDSRSNRTHRTPVEGARRPECPCCGARQFPFLDTAAGIGTTVLCGRNAVQVQPSSRGRGAGAQIDLKALATRLGAHGKFAVRGSTLVGDLVGSTARDGGTLELTVFTDGRAIVRGSTDTALAQSIYDRLVGN